MPTIRVWHILKSKDNAFGGLAVAVLSLCQLLRQANRDRPGRNVKADDLIAFSLELMTEQHIAAICDKMQSNKDRLEVLFHKFSKEREEAHHEKSSWASFWKGN